VHVADPTRWLSPGDDLDREARRRGRSLYFPWGSVPMFPKALAEGVFRWGGGGGGEGGVHALAVCLPRRPNVPQSVPAPRKHPPTHPHLSRPHPILPASMSILPLPPPAPCLAPSPHRSLRAGGGPGDGPAPVSHALSISATLTPEGALASWEVVPTLIRVTHK
jgi:hypothetical protein